MTEIDFYTQAGDKLAVACTLCAKAFTRGLRTSVHTPDAETSAQLDRILWTTPATGFLPHCSGTHPLARATPVIIDHDPEHFMHDQVLINLTDTLPSYFSRFERVLEIVGMAEEDKARARERFRFYRDRGYLIRTHDLLKTGET